MVDIYPICTHSLIMGAVNKDGVPGGSYVLSTVSLMLLFGVTCYFQSSLNLLQQQVENDRELVLKLQVHAIYRQSD